MTVLLESPGLPRLNLADWGEGWVNTGVEVGAPQPRARATNRPGGDGTIDLTKHVGARAITVEVAISEGPHSRRQLLDQLAPFLHVGRRTTLTFDDGDASREIVVRSDGAAPQPWRQAGFLRLVLGWVSVGYPYWLGEWRSLVLTPVTIDPDDGVTPPLTPPVVLPPGPPEQAGIVTNAGTVDAHWIAQIEGPVEDIAIENLTTGQQVALNGLTIGSGQTVVVDSFARSVTVDGERRFAAVDAAVSDWWLLPPGESQLAIPNASSSTPSRVWFRHRDTYL